MNRQPLAPAPLGGSAIRSTDRGASPPAGQPRRASTGRLASVAPWVSAALLLTGNPACEPEAVSRISVELGPKASLPTTLSIASAYAEYVELPAAGDELRITLSNYETRPCSGFVGPGSGQALITIVVRVPEGHKLAPDAYPWAGAAAHGGTPERPERAYARPTLRTADRTVAPGPGGELRLTRLELEPFGQVAGLLEFEFAGDAEQSASALRGRFQARLCRFAPKE